MLYYCSKCGLYRSKLSSDKKKCDCCKNLMKPIPDKYLNATKIFIQDELEQQFIDELVKTSPEFDQYLFDHRDEILAKQSAEFNAKMEHGRAILEEQNKQVTCPYCQSTRVSRIALLSRIVSVEFWGLASSKIGKQWRCHNCGSEF